MLIKENRRLFVVVTKTYALTEYYSFPDLKAPTVMFETFPCLRITISHDLCVTFERILYAMHVAHRTQKSLWKKEYCESGTAKHFQDLLLKAANGKN